MAAHWLVTLHWSSSLHPEVLPSSPRLWEVQSLIVLSQDTSDIISGWCQDCDSHVRLGSISVWWFLKLWLHVHSWEAPPYPWMGFACHFSLDSPLATYLVSTHLSMDVIGSSTLRTAASSARTFYVWPSFNTVVYGIFFLHTAETHLAQGRKQISSGRWVTIFWKNVQACLFPLTSFNFAFSSELHCRPKDHLAHQRRRSCPWSCNLLSSTFLNSNTLLNLWCQQEKQSLWANMNQFNSMASSTFSCSSFLWTTVPPLCFSFLSLMSLLWVIPENLFHGTPELSRAPQLVWQGIGTTLQNCLQHHRCVLQGALCQGCLLSHVADRHCCLTDPKGALPLW